MVKHGAALLTGGLLTLGLVAAPAGAEPLPAPAPTPAATATATAEAEAEAARRSGWPEPNFELDAYYSSASLNQPLTRERVPNLGESSEFEIYRYLLLRSYLPRFVTVEASVYPMPALGVYLKNNHPNFYRNGDIGSEVNVIESLTAGFREPYALSLFFGTLADFYRPGERRRGENRAYSGYLVSYGNRHIKDNRLYDDHWYEVEWKIKGDRDFGGQQLSWSFRVGTRQHRHPEIADTLYLGLRRSNLDFDAVLFSWLKNSSIAWMSEFSARDLRFLRQEVVFGKRLPLQFLPVALALEVGGIWQTNALYSGTLAEREVDNFVLIFRPNLVF